MAIIEQIFVDFAKKIEGSVWPANFLGVMQKSLIAIFFLKEPLNVYKAAGIILIVAGVYFIGKV